MFSCRIDIHVRRRAENSAAANGAVPLETDGGRVFSGLDSDMNVQGTGIALDSESQATGNRSLDEGHSMCNSC